MTVGESTGTLVMPDDATKDATNDPGLDATTAIPEVKPPVAAATRRRTGRFQRFWRAGAGVWAGLLIVALGFGLIAYTWGKVAALLDVALQLPYLVSGGLAGLGLILLGLLITNLAVKRREALERARQLDEIREALVRLRAAIEGEQED